MATTTPIDQTLQSLAALEAATEQNACAATEQPFIKLGTGAPPTLNYNIPQTTAFTTYGTMATAYIAPESFKGFTLRVPTNNFFNSVANMSAQQVEEVLHPAVAPTSVRPIVAPMTGALAAAHTAMAAAHTAIASAASAFHAASPVANSSTPWSVGGPVSSSFTLQQSLSTPSRSANLAKNNPPLRPFYTHALGRNAPKTVYLAKPQVVVPRIVVIEEYTTESFLGDYGAGRVVNSFSLFPGERTTISVTSYQDIAKTAIVDTATNTAYSANNSSATSDNVIDSLSDASAAEFDNALQQEQGNSDYSSDTGSFSGSSFSTSSDSQNSSSAWNVGGSVSLFGMVSIGGGYGQSDSDVSTSSNGMANNYGYSSTGIRSSNADAIANSLNKTVQSSNSARQNATSVNTSSASSAATATSSSTSTAVTTTTGSTGATVRELYNPNQSCTLNIIARNLLQQYTTVTYLSNLKFGYTNGYHETQKIVPLSNLTNMLADIIKPEFIDEVICTLLTPYCSVINHNDDAIPFLEMATVPNANCVSLALPNAAKTCVPTTETYWRKKKGLADTFPLNGQQVPVNGVILNVSQHTLVTPSIVWDALLGRGNALDCYNQKLQDATATGTYLDNVMTMQQVQDSLLVSANNNLSAQQDIALATQQVALATAQVNDAQQQTAVTAQQIQVIQQIGDPTQQATLYKKVFGDCCDVAQSGCGCNWGDTPKP